MQQWRHSALESITNVLAGYGVAIASQVLIFPWFGIHVSIRTNLFNRERMNRMAHRNYPYTQGEDNQIRAQIAAFNGSKIPANVYKTLAWTMANRHTVASLMSRASQLRHGRSGQSPDKPATRVLKQPEQLCKYPATAPVAREQQGLPLCKGSELVNTLRSAANSLQAISAQIIDRAALEEKCLQQQAKIKEYENIFRTIQDAANPVKTDAQGGQA